MIQRYCSLAGPEQDRLAWLEGFSNAGVSELKIKSVELLDRNRDRKTHFDYSEPFSFQLAYDVHQHLPFCRVGFLVHALDGSPVFEIYDVDEDVHVGRRQPGHYFLECEVPGNLLKPGRYSLSLNIGIPGVKNLIRLDGALQFSVYDAALPGEAMNLPRLGVIRPKTKWTNKTI